jgi:hypothetical protein
MEVAVADATVVIAVAAVAVMNAGEIATNHC